ncbi:MAG: hypothetical protein ACOY3P_19460 [Planctomycetota bacterium]
MRHRKVFLAFNGDEVLLGTLEELQSVARFHEHLPVTVEHWAVALGVLQAVSAAAEEVVFGDGGDRAKLTIIVR